LRKSSKKS